MTLLLRSLRAWVSPLMLAGLILAGALSVAAIAPTFVNDANAQLTTDDLLPDEFGEATQLGDADIRQTIGNLINVALGFLGIVAVIIILWGGFTWMTAGGNTDKVKDAQKIISYGVIGLAIILSAWAITNFVIDSFLDATSNSISE